MRFQVSRILSACLAFTMIPLFAAEDRSSMEIRPSGYLMTDGGYLNETDDVTLGTWKSEYFTSLIGGLRLSAHTDGDFGFVINPELRSQNIFPIRPGVKTGELVQRTRYEMYLEEAKGTWTFGNPGSPRGRIDFGYMTHIDNPDAKVLGNYLFRSMIYPGILFTRMDNPAAYLFGLHGETGFFGNRFRNKVFILSEVQRYPYYDLSIAYSGSYKFRDVLEFGVGVHAKSLIPARPSRTTPRGVISEGSGLPDNTYKFVPFQDSTIIRDTVGGVKKIIWVRPHADSGNLATVRIVNGEGTSDITDTVEREGNGIAGMAGGPLKNKAMVDLTTLEGGAGDLYPELKGTNTRYSFAGTLVGARVAFNVMGMFGDINPLGKGALKLYSEIAVLGWDNYPGFYEKRSERMPLMVGINLPTFNYLDFLSLEIEQYQSRHLPTFDRRAQLNVPHPGTHKDEMEAEWDEARRRKDDMKWVLTAKRTFGAWGLTLQAGTDHTKLMDDGDNDFYDAMTRPAHWYTQVRFFAGIR